MSKKPQAISFNRKSTRANAPANTQKENTDRLVEVAAEQLAVLLWKTWLHSKAAKSRKNKTKNYTKRPPTIS